MRYPVQGPHFNMAVKNQHVCQLKRHHINTASVITDKSRTEINRMEHCKHFSGTKISIGMLPELVLERQTDHRMGLGMEIVNIFRVLFPITVPLMIIFVLLRLKQVQFNCQMTY